MSAPVEGLPRVIAGLGDHAAPWPADRSPRAAAVMMLFIPPGPESAGVARIVLTRRSTSVRSHKGQIGFAGGRAEPEDHSPAVTALRELHEELGIAPELVTVTGILPSTSGLDGSAVVPVVGYARVGLEAMRPAGDEVESVFAAPWTAFRPEEDRPFQFNVFGRWRKSHLFELPGRPVWGLTALILASARFA